MVTRPLSGSIWKGVPSASWYLIAALAPSSRSLASTFKTLEPTGASSSTRAWYCELLKTGGLSLISCTVTFTFRWPSLLGEPLSSTSTSRW
ncbi:hypothetical protein FKM82_001340 [Ascaphus truei]